MHFDNDAYIALTILVSILLVTGGLAWFVISHLKR